ncbi:MAG: hypothetical protein WKF40_09865 [Thermoleophilaceae bacterium]
MERTASANGVAPRNTGKETRAAMIAQVGQRHASSTRPPCSRPRRPELQARRRPASLVEDEDLDGEPDRLMASEGGQRRARGRGR